MNAIVQAKSFLAFAADDAERARLTEAASAAGLDSTAVLRGSFDEARATLASQATPDLLVVDVSGQPDARSAVEDLALVCDAGAKIIILGEANDITLYRDLMRAGVQDYLPKPAQAADLAAAFERALVRDEVEASVPAKTRKATFLAVTGARGGVGASSIAASLAWLAAEKMDLDTVLIDLDTVFGTQALILDADPGRGFREALESPERIDGLFLDRAMIRKGRHLRLLAAEDSPDTALPIRADGFSALCANLRPEADLLVLDLPRHLAPAFLPVLEAPAQWLILGDPSLAAMRDAARLRKLVQNDGPTTVVGLNAVGRAKKAELPSKDFAAGIDCEPAFALPYDPALAARADAQARTWAEASTNAKACRMLNAWLSEALALQPKAKPGLFARLAGRG